MIQRIQTVYLLCVVGLLFVLFFNPLLTWATVEGDYICNVMGISLKGKVLQDTWPLMILMASCALIAFVTIFMYKNRLLQIRLCGLNIVLLLGFYGLLAYYHFFGVNKDVEHVIQFHYVLACPLLAAFLSYLALKAIAKDEALVRSLNRIR